MPLHTSKRPQTRDVFRANETLAQRFAYFAYGGIAGCVAKTCVSPLGRLKILLQTGSSKAGVVSTVNTIYQVEGIRGFWRGNLINCMRLFPAKGILFAANDILKTVYCTHKGLDKTKMGKLPGGLGFLTGALAGMTSCIAVYPMEIIGIRCTATVGGRPPTFTGLMRDLLREDGIRGLYKGSLQLLCNAIPYEGIKFGLYPIFKEYLRGRDVVNPNRTTTTGEKLLAGGAASLITDVLLFPPDTIRRVTQVQGMHKDRPQYNGFLETVKGLYREGGIRRFYRGCAIKCARSVPNSQLTFVVYEGLKEAQLL